MVLRLAGTLQVPVRDRNTLLLSAGHSPEYPEHDLNDPAMHAVRAALELILTRHEPHPAVVLDAGWNLLRANSAFRRLTIDVDPRLLEPPVNIARLVLHPDALAPSIVNLADWQNHVTDRLRRQVALTGNLGLTALLAEIQTYLPVQENSTVKEPLLGGSPQLTMPLHLRLSTGEFKLFSTIAAFGTPLDATVSELAIEMFFAADDTTAAALREPAIEDSLAVKRAFEAAPSHAARGRQRILRSAPHRRPPHQNRNQRPNRRRQLAPTCWR